MAGKVKPIPDGYHTATPYLVVKRAAGASEMDLQCTPPHDIPDRPVADHWPDGTGSDRIRAVMMKARRLLAEHEVNLVRRDLGCPRLTPPAAPLTMDLTLARPSRWGGVMARDLMRLHKTEP